MPLRKKPCVVRVDEVGDLVRFADENPDAQWFMIPKGDSIGFIDGEVIFHSVSEDVPIVTEKTIVVGLTQNVAVVGLVRDSQFEDFVVDVGKPLVKCSTIKLRY